MSASARVVFNADTAGYSRGLKKIDRETAAWSKETQKHGRRVGDAFKTAAKGAALGAVAIGGLVAKMGFQDITDGQKAMAQTNAVIASTKGAANVSAAAIQNLSNTFEAQTGVVAENVQAGANMLLTFTNIKNGVGKGNDVFNQATKAAADMSVAMGTDAKTAALGLGKALNDPAKGLTKLQRVGVTFTDQQKKQVAAMEKAGNTAGAQKVILRELTKEFGGSAMAYGTTLPGQIEKAKNAFGNMSGSIVSAFLPSVNRGLAAVNAFIAKMQAWANSDGGQKKLGEIRDGFSKAGDAVGKAASFIIKYKDTIIPLVAAVGAGVAVFKTLTAVMKAYEAVQGAINILMELNPFVLAATAAAALTVGIVVLYKRSETFRDIIHAIWGAIKLAFSVTPLGLMIKALQSVVNHFGGFRNVLSGIRDFALRVFLKIELGLLSFAAKATGVLAKIPGPMQDRFKRAHQAIENDMDKAQARLDKLNTKKARAEADKLQSSVNRNKSKVDGWMGSLNTFYGGIAKKLGDGASKSNSIGAGWPVNGPGGPGSGNASGVDSFSAAARQFGLTMTSGYRPGDDGYHGLNRARDWSNGSGPTPQEMAFAKYMYTNFGGKLKELIYTPMGTGIKDGRPVNIRSFYGDKVANDHYDHVHIAMRDGGHVRGPGTGTSDSIPARLSNGEYVVNAAATKRNRGLLEAINGGKERLYKAGGFVANVTKAATKSFQIANYTPDQAITYNTGQLNQAAAEYAAKAKLLTQQDKTLKAEKERLDKLKKGSKAYDEQKKKVDAATTAVGKTKTAMKTITDRGVELAGNLQDLAVSSKEAKDAADEKTKADLEQAKQDERSAYDTQRDLTLFRQGLRDAVADLASLITPDLRSFSFDVIPTAVDAIASATLRLRPTLESLTAAADKAASDLQDNLTKRAGYTDAGLAALKKSYDDEVAATEYWTNVRSGLADDGTAAAKAAIDAADDEIAAHTAAATSYADSVKKYIDDGTNLASATDGLADAAVSASEAVQAFADEQAKAAEEARQELAAQQATLTDALQKLYLDEGGNVRYRLGGAVINNNFAQAPNPDNWLATQEFLLGGA